jgi:4,5-dihydroxyphthalate decarboxylase
VNDLQLTLACGRNDRTQAILDGTISPEGVHLTTLALSPPEAFWRMLRHAEFDVSEISAAAYFTLLSRGDRRFIAIPVFLSRAFRHSSIFVNTAAGIEEPADLRGKRVGTPEYHLTTTVWARGLLEHEYGVTPRDFTWYTGGQREPGRKERIKVSPPEGVRIEAIPSENTLDAMIETGEVDAVIVPDIPAPFVAGSSRVRRLFPDFKQVEVEYYRRTGIFPIIHTVVVRRDVYDKHPWVAQSLFKAFSQAKDETIEALYDANVLHASLPWLIAELESERAVMGPDLWPYGVEPNRKTLEALKQYLAEQGLLESDFPLLEEAFASNTLDAYRR